MINVGDAPSLCKLCEEHKEFIVTDKEISESIFQQINSNDSPVNILIGSKKFTEGWSSWRVSTMGLMNIGKKEGSQIIQLFGRGVRLKGYNFSLMRSRRIQGLNTPDNLETLETLNVFGIRADYMRQFREYLEEEGLPSNEEWLEFILPVIYTPWQTKLKIIKLKEGVDFKRHGPKPVLDIKEDGLKHKVVLDWYPRIEALASKERKAIEEIAKKDVCVFEDNHIAFMNMDEIYFELQNFKNERAWYNFNLTNNAVKDLLLDTSWYTLYIPKDQLNFTNYIQTRQWKLIAVSLLKKYCDKFYKNKKAEYENEYLEYKDLDIHDSNLEIEYLFLIEQSRNDIVEKLNEIKEMIDKGHLKDINFQGLNTIVFDRHLYQPLIYLKSGYITVKPVALHDGEKEFVEDLRKYFTENKGYFDSKELYLLRNQSRGRGIGFFEAGNYYPDFILWLIAEKRQYINFIDPKGLRNIDGIHDPKIAFHKTIKELEKRLADAAVTLNSFILSNTEYREISWWSDTMSKEEFKACNVFFQKDDKNIYIRKIFEKII